MSLIYGLKLQLNMRTGPLAIPYCVHMYTPTFSNRSVDAKITRKLVYTKVLYNQQKQIVWRVYFHITNHLAVCISIAIPFTLSIP